MSKRFIRLEHALESIGFARMQEKMQEPQDKDDTYEEHMEYECRPEKFV